ncbi:MAG TPA: alpha/beta fold hydrolase [Candidatus Avipropionibacterium avicola]|uniref:Alpha/beta fold hydrolase n=1 Tax=Candidatus Avipropionibacterium avicola TaxID=2840701 RepID=A0A9D1GZF5_9ACTN|nr:alpha/beta fold hydrolase [Candidatus Avipropionibacterium avicola]
MTDLVPSLSPAVVAGAESFTARPERAEPAGAVLLCHGFTGSPRSMRPWAERLVNAGFEVSVPRLAGHGTSWQEMNRTTWQDWYGVVEAEFLRLAEQYGRVNLAALSMGGSLALRLAARYPEQVAAAALVNPSVASADPKMHLVPLLSLVVDSIDAIADDIAKPGVTEGAYPRTPLRAVRSMMRLWRAVRADLDRVQCPILMFRSEVDHVVDPTSAEIIMGRVGSESVTERILHRSFHVATLDFDADDIFAESAAFFLDRADEAG